MNEWNQSGAKLIERVASEFAGNGLIAFEAVVIDVSTEIVVRTPIGLGPKGDGVNNGKARANWQIGRKVTKRVLRNGNKTKGRQYAENKLQGKFAPKGRLGSKLPLGGKMYLFNNSGQINTLESGGYPDPVKFGTYNSRTRRYEKRSRSGFSKQAPVGMMRTTIIGFGARMRWANQR